MPSDMNFVALYHVVHFFVDPSCAFIYFAPQTLIETLKIDFSFYGLYIEVNGRIKLLLLIWLGYG